jgi:hypothetical protein
LSIHEDVQVMSEGEWPEPTVTRRRRHWRARVMAFSTSARDCGWMKSSGSELKVRAQVRWVYAVRARKGMASEAWVVMAARISAGRVEGREGEAILAFEGVVCE